MSGVITPRSASLCGVSFLFVDTKRAREVRIEFAWRHRRLADIALLRRLAKAARHRGARPVRVGEIGAAIPRIVRRRREFRWLRFTVLSLLPLRSLFPSPLWGGARGGGREATRVGGRHVPAGVDSRASPRDPPPRPSPTRGEGVDGARFFSSRPVCEPTPARPRPMPGLSKSASDGSSGAESGRAALARVGFAGSFFECLAGSRYFGGAGRSGLFAMARIWAVSGSGESAAVLASVGCNGHAPARE